MVDKKDKAGQRRHWSTRQLAVLALFTALSVILSFIEIPLPFIAAFLKYDASFVPAIMAALVFGPVSGVVVGVLAGAIHMLAYGDIWGGLMNILVVLAFVLPAGALFGVERRRLQESGGRDAKAVGRLVLSLSVGCAVSVCVALSGNLLITPVYMGVDVSVVVAMLPLLLVFNVVKEVLNSVLTALVLHPLAPKLFGKGK